MTKQKIRIIPPSGDRARRSRLLDERRKQEAAYAVRPSLPRALGLAMLYREMIDDTLAAHGITSAEAFALLDATPEERAAALSASD